MKGSHRYVIAISLIRLKILFDTMKFLSKVKQKRRRTRLHQDWYNHDLQFCKSIDLPELTQEEIQKIQSAWPCFDWRKEDYLLYRVYKKFNGFSPYFVAGYQSHYIWKCLNPRELSVSLSNKAYMDYLYPEIPFPKSYLRGITGNLYDADMNFMTLDESVKLLSQLHEFIIKPSVSMSYGKGVEKVTLPHDPSEAADLIKKAIHRAGPDFIVQEVLKQHPVMAELNPTSVNSFRFTSIYVDGKYAVSVGLKIGKLGSHIDNWNSGYYVGVSNEGKINDVGYDIRMNPVKETDTHIAFGNVQIPNFDKMKALVEHVHKKYFPMSGIIGWDMMVDQDGNPRAVEFNLRPDFFAEQIGAGTFFEPFCDIICEKIKGQNVI